MILLLVLLVVVSGCSTGPLYGPTEDIFTEQERELFCSDNSFDCEDFETQVEAQQMFEDCSGVDNDIHELDEDNNGVACESLP